MQITRNEWSPLFADLKDKLDANGRRILLSRMIGTIQEITQSTFGPDGTNRPEPWESLKQRYADEFHSGDTTPTLLLSDEKHSLAANGPHLIDSFSVSLSAEQASLTNVSPYADTMMFGLGAVPARPFYPIDEAGQLTPFAEAQLAQVVNRYFQSQS